MQMMSKQSYFWWPQSVRPRKLKSKLTLTHLVCLLLLRHALVDVGDEIFQLLLLAARGRRGAEAGRAGAAFDDVTGAAAVAVGGGLGGDGCGGGGLAGEHRAVGISAAPGNDRDQGSGQCSTICTSMVLKTMYEKEDSPAT